MHRRYVPAVRVAIPAQAGIHLTVSKKEMDSGLRRNDGIRELFDVLYGYCRAPARPDCRHRSGIPLC